jgi:hypothetical protein
MWTEIKIVYFSGPILTEIHVAYLSAIVNTEIPDVYQVDQYRQKAEIYQSGAA